MKILSLFSLGVAAILTNLPGASLNAQQMDEYQVKAAFLYNFAKFVEWPAETGGAPGALTICILGRDPFGQSA